MCTHSIAAVDIWVLWGRPVALKHHQERRTRMSLGQSGGWKRMLALTAGIRRAWLSAPVLDPKQRGNAAHGVNI